MTIAIKPQGLLTGIAECLRQAAGDKDATLKLADDLLEIVAMMDRQSKVLNRLRVANERAKKRAFENSIPSR